MKVGLVGCVKSKLPHPAPAKDLYTSALFRGARCYVERTCGSWFILSAQHGLVHPDEALAPYERTLTTAPASERTAWSNHVLEMIDTRIGRDLSTTSFEIHAGAAYTNFGLVQGLQRRGACLDLPLEGLGLGRRLRFYKEAGCL